ncbi:DUF6460 domain-containing protein [Kordiimonas sp. SCSIO 12610]|uniref:DUF6460 domain-containing protein n=1 Tax=Kordiimonas sp. SCSIO 12610 TaxID=2829597 RepID=UPI00210A9E0A|nr:DUF6460 domain-containing protein [Kordiimonas sp. SCSIO 12610]UTW55569.1 hypothetical protein KFF44_01350 [Kordiimonas sp. SCSIO 12610]
MASKRIDAGTIIKLALWSLAVGFVLYQFKASPGDIYGWIANKIAGLWSWLVGSGLEYMMLGAAIVVPIFLISHFRGRSKS